MARTELTKKIVRDAADQIHRIFLSKADEMRETFERLPGNLPVGVKVVWKPSAADGQVNADIKIQFKLDEVADQESFTFIDGPGPIFEYGSDDDGDDVSRGVRYE